MKFAGSISMPTSEAAAEKALYVVCDVGLFLALSIIAIFFTLIVWCPLELLQHSLHATHGTQGGRV